MARFLSGLYLSWITLRGVLVWWHEIAESQRMDHYERTGEWKSRKLF